MHKRKGNEIYIILKKNFFSDVFIELLLQNEHAFDKLIFLFT